MPFYRNIFKQALAIAWCNKYLWWFGIFAVLLGNAGEFDILFNNSGGRPSEALFPFWQKIAATGIFSSRALANIGNLFKDDTLNMILITLICIAALAIFLFLVSASIIAQAAIVNNSSLALAGKKHFFRQGMNCGIANFWPVLTLNIIMKAAIFALLAAISLPIFFLKWNLNTGLFYAVILTIFLPIAIILSFILKYAIASAVIKKNNIAQAIKHGFALFRSNWLVSFEMAVALFCINMVFGLAIVLAILVLAVPFLFLFLVFSYWSLPVSWLIVVLAYASALFIVIFSGAGLSVFQISSWTGLFLELDKNAGQSKLGRIVSNFAKSE